MQTDKLQVEVRAGSRDGQHVIRVVGPVTLSNVAVLRDAAKSTTQPKLIIDLTEVPYIDSAALGAFVHTYVSFRNTGRRLALVGMTNRVSNVFHLASLDVLFSTYSTVEEAEQALA
jgi:anti-sigma B factor antagonist